MVNTVSLETNNKRNVIAFTCPTKHNLNQQINKKIFSNKTPFNLSHYHLSIFIYLSFHCFHYLQYKMSFNTNRICKQIYLHGLVKKKRILILAFGYTKNIEILFSIYQPLALSLTIYFSMFHHT